MASEWLVISNPDGREFEVLTSDWERLSPANWPGFTVVGFKDGGVYHAPKPEKAEIEPEQKAAAKAAVAAVKK